MRHTLAIACLTLLVLSGAAVLLGACNTTEGFGKDVAAGGTAIERSAERNK
jgi:predicted small secreted protein